MQAILLRSLKYCSRSSMDTDGEPRIKSPGNRKFYFRVLLLKAKLQ